MECLRRVECIQGDLRAQATIATLLETLAGSRATLVMSDMSPNMSGVEAIDQPRAIGLAELALELAQRIVVPGGDLLVKVFQGDGYDGFMENLRSAFAKVVIRKPRASRSRSRELYLLARGSLAGRSFFPCGVE
jgi:23S rRNA (uridine2552-2'-O)-methyltransferase